MIITKDHLDKALHNAMMLELAARDDMNFARGQADTLRAMLGLLETEEPPPTEDSTKKDK